MKKMFGVISLLLINGSSVYLIYLYVSIACSTKVNNLLQVAYEPSGMQMYFLLYIVSNFYGFSNIKSYSLLLF
ncbi:hypothetical protein ULM_35500 (plasmid) [Legionella pneumophila]|nr:hypothetical protein ULM_35500 [Legionella pneumophila]